MSSSLIAKQQKKKLWFSVMVPLLFVGLLWLVKFVELGLDTEFYRWGIYPRTLSGLKGVIASPFIHRDFVHLFSNSIPLLVSMAFIVYFYRPVAFRVFFWIILMTGAWTWIMARPSYHIGASGLVYGFVCFLFFGGVFRRNRYLLAISLLITFLYGGMVWGVLPLPTDVSWEAHLMGSIAGLACAIYYRNVGKVVEPPVLDDDDEVDFDDWMFVSEEDKHLTNYESVEHQKEEIISPFSIQYHFRPRSSDKKKR